MRIDRLVKDVAALVPRRIAVQEATQAMTYSELDTLANRFANLLLSLGVRAGDRVGVQMPRSGVAIAAFLGASRAGAVFVPLDPSSPPARTRLIATDCGLRHLVVAPELLASWLEARPIVSNFVVAGDAGPSEDAATSRLPEGCRACGWREVQAASAAALASPGHSPDDLAYLLYTSGSTGVPKGVMLSHRNAFAFIAWASQAAALTAQDRIASVAPFHFDLSVFDIWATLRCGATLVIVDEATVLSGRRMVESIAEQEITVWYSVPSALVLMLESGALTEPAAAALRVVFFAGEVFPLRHLRRLMAALPRVRYFNLFGPTETNVCLAHELPGVPPEEATAIPIGRPACGDQAFAADEAGQPVPDGAVGELLVDGPTVMLGYWNGGMPLPVARPYRTGDFVVRRDDGEFLYHGRRDHLVKVRGFRIELGEVEAALALHPGVREAVVMARDGRLVAIVHAADPGLSVLAVKRHCSRRVPPYMIPTEIHLVGELPRTSTGKLDRLHIENLIGAGDLDVPAPPTANARTP